MADRKKKPGHDDAWWAAQRHAYIEKNDILLSDYPSWEWVSPYDFWRTIFPDGFLQPRGEVVPWHERGGGHPNGIAIQITHKTKTVKTKTGIEHDVPVIERFTLSPSFAHPCRILARAALPRTPGSCTRSRSTSTASACRS